MPTLPFTCDRSPPPLIAPLHLRSLPSTCDRSLPPAIAPFFPRSFLRTLPSTCDRSPPPRSLPSTCDRSSSPLIASLHLRSLPSTCSQLETMQSGWRESVESGQGSRRSDAGEERDKAGDAWGEPCQGPASRMWVNRDRLRSTRIGSAHTQATRDKACDDSCEPRQP